MAELLNDTKKVLNDVIETLVDGQKGFQDIGEHIKDATLKQFFMSESLKRAQFRGDLEDALHKEGVHDVKSSGSVAGAIHRTWGDLKARLTSDDGTLLDTALQGEDTAQKSYSDALKHQLPSPIHQMLSQQAAHVTSSHDYIQAAATSRKSA